MNAQTQVAFTTDRRRCPLAYRWSAAAGRWFRVGLADAKRMVATGEARVVRYAPAKPKPARPGGVRIALTEAVCGRCGQPTVAEADEHGGMILVAPMVLEGSRSWSCDKAGGLTLDGKPITPAELAAALKAAR